MNLYALALAVLLLLGGACSDAYLADDRAAAAVPAAASAASAGEERAERDLVNLANEERRKRGLPDLEFDERLREAARRHSRRMAEAGALAHQLDGEPVLMQRVAATGLRFDRVAENVSRASDALNSHQGLMSSPPHRANLLSQEYNAIGVGVAERGDHLWVTQNFARKLPERSANQAEQNIVEQFQRLRRELGISPLAPHKSGSLREMACVMAQKDELDAKLAPPTSGRRRVLAFTLAHPEELPDSVREMAAQKTLESYSLGVCFERTPTYPSGIFWVLMAFYY